MESLCVAVVVLTIIDREKLTVTNTTLPRNRLDDQKCQKCTGANSLIMYSKEIKIDFVEENE